MNPGYFLNSKQNTYMSTLRYATKLSESLTSALHEHFINCGQIFPVSYIAEFISEFESENCTKLSDREIFKAIFDASNSFVDSMQANVMDGYNYEGRHRETETELEETIAHWEAMRPQNVRSNEIASMLADTKLVGIPAYQVVALKYAVGRFSQEIRDDRQLARERTRTGNFSPELGAALEAKCNALFDFLKA